MKRPDPPEWMKQATEKFRREEDEMILAERARTDKEPFDFEKLSKFHDVNERWGPPHDLAMLTELLERQYYLDHSLTSMVEYAARLNDRNIYD